MKRIVVTGANGFIGRNLILHLSTRNDTEVFKIDVDNVDADLESSIDIADYVFHLAGVNRSLNVDDFEKGNHDLTALIVNRLLGREKKPVVVATSSIQATLDNPYGRSKKNAERELSLLEKNGAHIYVYRLPNVFGKWSRPFYNSVVATFCHQVAHGNTPTINDPNVALSLVYIDDVIKSFVGILDGVEPIRKDGFCGIGQEFHTTVGELAKLISSFPETRSSGIIPDFKDLLTKYLYSTFLTYYPSDRLLYTADKKADTRGFLYEFIRSQHAGQIFVSRTLPGVTRGNHYHHTKVEKFCVLDGTALVSLRNMITNEIISYSITGQECCIIDIPPGFTHSIKNVGSSELITLFWANEIFNPDQPDTYRSEV